MKCKICSRETRENDFCSLHIGAYCNIIDSFEVWQKASSVSWLEYLLEVQKNSLTGEWAKEVVKYLLEDGKKDVT